MNDITSTKTIAQRARQLRVLVAQLRYKLRQVSICVELNSHPVNEVARVLHQQLKVLVPLYRVLAVMEQHAAPTDKAKALYLTRHAAALTLVEGMVMWANDDSAYGGLLALMVPVRTEDFFAPSAPVISLGDHLMNQRELLYKKKRLSVSLVEQLIQSLTLEQRALLAQYYKVSGGHVFEISSRQLEVISAHTTPVVEE